MLRRGYTFGPFFVDPVKRVLLKDDEPVPLAPKALEVLLTLIEQHGELVDKDQLMSKVWPDAIVEENNLTQAVSRLRRALDEKPNDHRYIVTIPGRGYSFVGDISQPVPEAGEGAATVRAAQADGETRNVLPRLAALLLVAAFAIVSAGVLVLNREETSNFEKLRVTQLATKSNVSKAALSPDGRYVAYAAGEPGEQSLMLRMVHTDVELELAPPSERYYLGLTFSPDGNHLYYVARSGVAPASSLYRSAVLGGQEELVKSGLASPVSFSPDGSQFAFVREDRNLEKSVLVLAEIGNGSEVELASRAFPEFMDYPAWSPDGKTVACTVVRTRQGNVELIQVEVETGSERLMTPRAWCYVRQLAWSRAGDSLLFSGRDCASEVFGIWRLSRKTGETRRIVENLDHLVGVSLAADSRSLVTVQERLLSSIWIEPEGPSGRARQIRPDAANHSGAAWMPDGRVLFDEIGSEGRADLWIMNSDGTGVQRLTDGGNNFNGSACPSGRSVLFVSDRSGSLDIWQLVFGGGQPEMLVQETGETFPQCSPDGRWVIYTALGKNGWPTLWKASVESREPFQMSAGRALRPSVSPNGRFVACFYTEDHASPQEPPRNLAVISMQGGAPVRLFPTAQTVDHHPGIKWTPDGSGIAYVDNRNDISNIWVQPLDGGPPRQLTTFEGGRIFHFDWPREGKPLLYTSGRLSREVVLIREED